MIHLKKKRIFALAVLAFIVACLVLPLTAFGDNDVPADAKQETEAVTVEAEAPAEEVDEETAANNEAVKFLSESKDFDKANLSEDEVLEYTAAANTFIDNYSTNVSEEPQFAENLNKALDAKRSETPTYATLWSLLPPLIAIVLALITKEVYSSLFIGILAGALLYANFNVSGTIDQLFTNGFIASIADSYNIGILIFLVVLGVIVSLMNKSGGSAAFGRWASTHIKSRVGAQLATIALGVLIFVDDYFNCLTVGSVMRPVTDKFNVSRSKLSYLIDATAAPVCIIAPISSWAAAVAGFVSEDQVGGFELFIKAIPFNFYAILTIIMMIVISVLKFDYGPMKKHEMNAVEKGDIFSEKGRENIEKVTVKQGSENGIVLDLIAPVVVLIIACMAGLIYSGGFFTQGSEQYHNFVTAFSSADASVGLVIGSFVGLIFSIIYFLCRRVLSFKDCMDSLPEGFNAMVPAILILCCAWTLKTMTDSLGAKILIAEFVRTQASAFLPLLPCIVFLIGVGLSFATGTSWGTFGILIPIVLAIFGGSIGNPISIVAISACMAGAVCGDHCSPISDTTIMSSAGAQCNHINHVSTQLPYALTVAVVSAVTYLIAGIVPNAWVALPVGIVLMVATLLVIKATTARRAQK